MRRFWPTLLLLPLVLFTLTCSDSESPPDTTAPDGDPAYLNPDLPVAERVTDLLDRMTLEEKVGQMTQAGRSFLTSDDDITTWYLGSLLSGGGSAPSPNNAAAWADMVDGYQAKALATRLRIPILYGVDAVHGHNNVFGAVIFPHNIGLGATRNPALVEQVAAATAREVAGTGIHWTFAPCIAVPRDERWGRTYEGFGETAELAESMGAASVRGLQGDDLADRATVLACAKHFIADGATTGGDDQGDARIDFGTLQQVHLPGYIAAIEEGVGTIMISYSSWNGEKMHGNRYLLTTVLKEQLGFDGFLISDWAAIDQLPGDYTSDVEQSVNAGLDMVMVPDRYSEFITTLIGLVNQGRVSMSRIDDAVRRILTIKFRMGLFENPYTERSLTGTVGSPAHRDLARQAVRESLVLLKNDNAALPLSKAATRIHVAGRNADNLGHQCGGWSISWQGGSGDITVGTTILDGIRAAVDPGATVTFSEDGSGAAGADAVVVVIGEGPYAEGAGDRDNLALDGEDLQAIANAAAAGVPVIAVLVSGRPMIIGSILDDCDAVVAAWLPGTEGAGVADVLFGDHNFSGQLGHSWPASMNQIPINVDTGADQALFPYGHGLRYP